MPKVELHKHLAGSVRLSTLLELVPSASSSPSLVISKPLSSLTEFVDRIAFEVVEDSSNDGIVLLELRYTPFSIARAFPQLTPELIHDSILKGIKKGMKKFKIVVGLIGIIDRNLSFEEAKISMDFFIAHKDTFVAVDLANDEVKYSADPFVPLFARAREEGFRVTIHAGETLEPSAPSNVRQAIEDFGAVRIGHGVMAIKDPNVIQLIKEKNIVLEVCPWSNYLTGLVDDPRKHPIADLLSQEEYEKLLEYGLLTGEDINKSNRVALEASFMDQKAKQDAAASRHASQLPASFFIPMEAKNFVELKTDKGVATITLQRPDRGNSLTPEMVREIVRVLEFIKTRQDVRVVVLTGSGKFFCTGMDLTPSNQAEMSGKMASGETSSMAITFYETLKQFPKPIVSRINGSALGGGWGLLFCTDIRVAVSSAWFSFAEVKRGIVPAIISAYVVPELGPFQSRKLFLTGEKITAQKGKELGFLSDVAADEAELDKIVSSYVTQLLENGPKAMKMAKTLVAHNDNHSHDENVNFVKGIFEKYVVTSKEARYGMEMFMKKKTPDWAAFYAAKL